MSARWIEPEGRARDVAPVCSSSTSGSARQRSRAAIEQLADLRRRSSTWPFRSLARVEREAEHADRVGLARPEERRRHREVLVDAREHIGCVNVARAPRRRRLERRLAVGDPVRVAGRACSRICSSSKPAMRAVRERDQQRVRLPTVRVVATRRRPAPAATRRKKSSRSTGLHDEVSKKTPRCPAKQRGEVAEVGDARVGDDQLRAGVRSTSLRSSAAIGGSPRPPWIRIGTLPLGREREDRREPLVVQQESLRARVELDPAGAEVEAPLAPPRSAPRQVEPDERDQPPVRALGERERAVVRRAEAGMPVGLVEAEHERAATSP